MNNNAHTTQDAHASGKIQEVRCLCDSFQWHSRFYCLYSTKYSQLESHDRKEFAYAETKKLN